MARSLCPSGAMLQARREGAGRYTSPFDRPALSSIGPLHGAGATAPGARPGGRSVLAGITARLSVEAANAALHPVSAGDVVAAEDHRIAARIRTARKSTRLNSSN